MRTTLDLCNQSTMVDCNPHHRRSKLLEKNQPLTTLYDDVKTVHDIIVKGMELSNDAQCLGWRPTRSSPYVWLKYSQVLERAKNLGAAFVHFGLDATPNSLVGIYSKNRPEWLITEHACYLYSMVLVPIYDTLGKEACQFICNQTQMRVIVCDSNERAMSLMSNIVDDNSGKINFLHTIIVTTVSVSAECRLKADALDIKIYPILEAETIGKQTPRENILPKPTDLCTICYTSGTTGMPKGAMITHANIVATTAGVLTHLGTERFTPDDVLFSFLPLAHMFERMIEATMLLAGGSVGYYSGDIVNISDDMCALKPTIIMVVPRLLNRIFDAAYSKAAASKLKSTLFHAACWIKARYYVERGTITNETVWDKVVFKGVREIFGGRIRLLACGSAPLHENVLQFMRCAMGCVVIEGYGCTETTAATTATLWGDHAALQVGPPLIYNEVKLEDVPEMSLSVEHGGRGEICIRGANVFSGYYKAPELTAQVLDTSGWLHTGDIGQWTETGTLRIVDRRKNMFKLAQGEYVVPDKIENIYARHALVEQAYVYGEPLRSCCVALIVVNEVALRALAKQCTITDQLVDDESQSDDDAKSHLDLLCASAQLSKNVLDLINQFAKKTSDLQSYELARTIKLLSEPFTVENGLLTPTMKTKRHDVKQRYSEALLELYAQAETKQPKTK